VSPPAHFRRVGVFAGTSCGGGRPHMGPTGTSLTCTHSSILFVALAVISLLSALNNLALPCSFLNRPRLYMKTRDLHWAKFADLLQT